MMETSMRSFVLKGLTAEKYRVWYLDPETGERTEIEEIFYPVDGKIEYESDELFGNRRDCLVVVEAVE